MNTLPWTIVLAFLALAQPLHARERGRDTRRAMLCARETLQRHAGELSAEAVAAETLLAVRAGSGISAATDRCRTVLDDLDHGIDRGGGSLRRWHRPPARSRRLP